MDIKLMKESIEISRLEDELMEDMQKPLLSRTSHVLSRSNELIWLRATNNAFINLDINS